MEDLDIRNIIEIDKIRDLLRPHPDLLSLFEVLCITCNKRLNDEPVVSIMNLEPNEEPELSDHSSDEE